MKRLIILLLIIISSYSAPITIIKTKNGLNIRTNQQMLCSLILKNMNTTYKILFIGPTNYPIRPLFGKTEIKIKCTSSNGFVVQNLTRVYLFPKKRTSIKRPLYNKEVSKALRLYDMFINKDPNLYKEIEFSYVLYLWHKDWKDYLDKIIEKEKNLQQHKAQKIDFLLILKNITNMHNKIRVVYQVLGIVTRLKNCIKFYNNSGYYPRSCFEIYIKVKNELVSLIKSFKNSLPKYIIYTNRFNKTFKELVNIAQKINQSLNSDQDLVKNVSILENYLNKILEIKNKFKTSLIKKKVIVIDYKNRRIPFAVVTVNNFFANLTNFNGSIILYLVNENQSINATVPGYRFLAIKKDKDTVVIVLKPMLNLSPIVYHYLVVNYTYGAICSTRNQPHCISSYNGTVYLHPNSTIIKNLVSIIPKNYITLCKSGVNCTKLLWNISALIHGVVKYNKHCLTKNLTEFKKYCMAWWDSDLDIVKYHSGVCSDYARLALSILRSLGIPARYVVIHGWAFGFGYFDHVFTQVYVNGHWIFYDPLWNYTVVPQYPLLCVDSIYTPYAVTYDNITIVRNISLIKDLLKYYNISTNCSKAL